MSTRAATNAPKAAGNPVATVLQRKCACGKGASALSGDCTDCQREKALGLQTKLSVGERDDPLEREADRLADQVLAMAHPAATAPVHGTAAGLACRTPLAVSSTDPTANGSDVPEIVGDVLRSSGQPLTKSTRQFMESRFGHDFGHIRVHTGSTAAASAAAVTARAYTVGHDLVFGAGEYAPDTMRGRRLLAHELVHSLQQQQGTPRVPLSDAIPPRVDRGGQETPRLDHKRAPGSPTLQPVRLQRACGPAAIGSVAGCTGRGGDIVDFGGSSDRIFLFETNCDDFKAGEEARLRAVARTIDMTTTVEVDGFSSEEGDPAFNEELSCARAHAAARILASEGFIGAIGLFKHGATPGAREDRRSAVITVQSPAPAAEPPPRPPPRRGPPAAATEDCTPAQATMLQSHLHNARAWVDDATRKVTDYAAVFASSRYSAVPASPATAAVVRTALTDNFHTTSSGHVLDIRDGFQELRRELNRSLTFECEDEGCADLAYVRGAFSWIRRLGDIHVCPPWFRCPDYFSRVKTLIHERAHQHPGATDNAYEWQASYATLSPSDAIDNAESFAVAARQIYHGGAHGPGTGLC